MRRRRCHGGEGRCSGVRAVIIGAGDAGRALARALLEAEGDLTPVGFLDDALTGETVSGLPVLGGTVDITAATWPARTQVVVVAIPSLPPVRVASLVGRVAEAGLDVRYVPPGAAAGTDPLRLLGRDELAVASIRARRFVSGRRVLVTGACGTVGARLCRRLRTLRPAALIQLDNDEKALARLTAESETGRPAVVDIRDASRVDALFEEVRPELVLHAAGFNHDPRWLERQPCAAVRANVLGTRNLVRAAVRQDVERFVLVSTDQAAEPVSVLGATRRLSELVLQAEAGGQTCFAAVRVGSVLGSGTSPLGAVAGQLAAGQPVTVTHPDAARHLMSAREAAELVLEATAMAEDAETFALDTGPPSSVLGVVGALVDGLRLPDVTIRFTGLGPGERLRARSFADSEAMTRTAHPLIYATRGTMPSHWRNEPLTALLDAAARDADDEVRALMRRILPEYRPQEERP
ncbi:FlaA1/EpsC-like NDP-sugar epimerase [Actinoallomurus bryophytorum]|uniref:FlaA1/EpsC-like NDP-sugar epimerase n=1 Tax=Actinoallomurus bryophytorum TaxID=1490222 RepID=A0A543CNA9_9ACTN|nr:polysaccharide biosynthesis protein [Actinoallomurus bryophytorum]TQL98591.1 FlaA1/EpsC-like NDP-sugar epimerase [Actinoallomurus bryophytorum]